MIRAGIALRTVGLPRRPGVTRIAARRAGITATIATLFATSAGIGLANPRVRR
jgi:hypothetical protein